MAVTSTLSLQSVRTEFQANGAITGTQAVSNVIALANGGYAVAYSDPSAGTSPRLDIYDSPTDTTPTMVNPSSGTVDMLGGPSIIQLATGEIMVSWREGPSGSNQLKHAFVSTSSGSVGTVLSTQDAGAFSDIETVLGPDNTVGMVAVNALGVGVVQINGVNTVFNAGPTSDPAIAFLSGGDTTGRYVVAHVSNGLFSIDLLGADGNSLGGFYLDAESEPQVAALRGGGYAVVFKSPIGGQQGTNDVAIMMAVFNENGAFVDIARVDATAATEESDPEITVLSNGMVLVTYTEAYSGSDNDVRARLFSVGLDVNAPFPQIVAQTVNGSIEIAIDRSGQNESQSSAAALADGMVVTTWTDSVGDGSGTRISGRIDQLVRISTGDGEDDEFGNDELRDIFSGGAGNDTYHLGAQATGFDTVTENVDEGNDTITSTISRSLADYAHVENITLLGTGDADATGNAVANILTGNAGANALSGLAGDDTLVVNAGDLTGFESYDGGSGGETFGDTLELRGSGGSVLDFRFSSVVNIERLQFSNLTGDGATARFNSQQIGQFSGIDFGSGFHGLRIVSIDGNGAAAFSAPGFFINERAGDGFELNGGAGNDTITGSRINDTITGGTGKDTLNGLDGDDTFVVSNGLHVVADETYDGGTGTDTLRLVNAATVFDGLFFDFREASIKSIERVTIEDAADLTDIGNITARFVASQFGTGSSGPGISLDATFDFASSANVDIDNDTAQSLDLSKLKIIAPEGVFPNFSIFSGNSVTDITLVGTSASDFIFAGRGDDTIRGGDGDDSLTGFLGADHMFGGAGDDSYSIDDAGDIADETGGDGIDLVDTNIDFSLADTARVIGNLENLRLNRDGLTGVGNELDNNFITFAKGVTIDGGGGVDTFQTFFTIGFTTMLREGGVYKFFDAPGGNLLATVSNVEKFEMSTDSGRQTFDVRTNPDAFITQLAPTVVSVVEAGIDEDRKPATLAVAENSAVGTKVATVTAADLNLGGSDVLTFRLEKAGGGAFVGPLSTVKISATKAEIRVSGAIDFETLKSLAPVVKVTDSTGKSVTKAVSIAVVDINEAPDAPKLSKASVTENRKAGTLVGTLSAGDPDGDAGATFKLTKNPGGFFKIVGNQLQTTRKLDFERAPGHAITVEVTDVGGLKTTQTFTIKVNDVVDVITGTSKKNTLTGAKGADKISGLGGKDKLLGKGGKDILDGGTGNDTLVGGSGGDTLRGGKGIDTASYEDASAKVTASLKNPKKNKGDAAGDSYDSIENLTGSAFADRLTGNDGANLIRGGKGGDTLDGGKGDDVLRGGGGKDVKTGGAGDDVFLFAAITDSGVSETARDVITDFTREQDTIDLSAIDARAASKKTNQKFSFIGENAFSKTAGELRYENAEGTTFVYGDVTGDGKADFSIELAGSHTLTVADFVL